MWDKAKAKAKDIAYDNWKMYREMARLEPNNEEYKRLAKHWRNQYIKSL